MTQTPFHNRPFDLPAAIEEQRQQLLTKLQLQGIAPEERTAAADAVEGDPDTWRTAVLPRWYGKPDGFFHREAWQKIWAVTDDLHIAPRPLLLPWFRYAGKCLEGDTEILLANGSRLPIRDIESGAAILSLNEETGKFEADTIVHKWATGRKGCVEVRTRTGKRLRLTPDHRVRAFDGWAAVKDLRVGDRIALPRRAFCDGSVERTDEEIRFLAYMLAEGSLTSNHCDFTNADTEIVEDFKHCAAVMGFGVRQTRGAITYRLTVGKANPRAWARAGGMGHLSKDKRIPDWMFKASVRQKCQFLAAFIDTDGWVSQSRASAGITLASKGMIDDLVYLFVQIGVITSLHYKPNDHAGAWQLEIEQGGLRRCAELLPLRLKAAKLQRAAEISDKRGRIDVYPFYVKKYRRLTERSFRAAGMPLSLAHRTDLSRAKMRRMIAHDPAPEWVWLEQADVFWDRIEAIEDIGEHETFDVEVARNHNLITNGIVSHNSATIRGGAVALAARRKRKFFLYFSAVQDSADRHVTNIARMLQTPEMARYYPDLANPMLSQVTGAQVSWSRKQIVTRGGVVFVALGLESAARGINWEEIRPDVIIVDDIDKLRDSVQVVQNKIEVLGSDIFPAGQENTWIVFAQNVIHSQSVMRRTIDRTSGILIDHDIIGPVPAVYNLSYEKKINPESGAPRFFFMPGSRASWPEGFDIPVAEQHFNNSGPLRFEREYQHNTDILPSGAIYPGYNPLVHLVTVSELAAAFARQGVNLLGPDGSLRIPFHWNKAMGLDFGTTDEHPTAIKWVTTPPELEPFGPTDKRAGLVIWYRERTLPKYPHLPGERQEPVSPMGIARLIHSEEKVAREAYGMRVRVMSHEQSAARGTFNIDFDEKAAEDVPGEFKGLGFVKVKPDRWGGIATMQNFFEVDYSQPNQFRRYPAGYKVVDQNSGELVDLSGQPLPGRVRQVFVVADGQGELYVDDTGALKVTSAVDDDGMIRSRAERMQYTEKVNVSGDSSRFPNDFFNDQCLVAGTLIETDRGPVPIEEVTATDRVLTREGYRPCSGAFLTNPAADVQTLLFSDGRTLTGTGNHPVWCEEAGEFIPMDALRYSATMRTCREHQSSRARSSSSMASASTVTLSPGRRLTGTTSSRITTNVSRASARSMRRYGRLRTAPSLPDIRFITRISIRSITTSLILNVSPRLSISSATKDDQSAKGSGRTSPTSKPAPLSGTVAKRGGLGTGHTLHRIGKPDNLSHNFVSSAEANTKPSVGAIEVNSVLLSAKQRRAGRARLTRCRVSAFVASLATSVINTANDNSAPTRVVRRIVETERCPTYNLTVEGQPEYFANGILVHNCDAERMIPAKAIEAGILFVAAALAPEDVRHEHDVARTQPGLTRAALAARPPGQREGAYVARMMLDRYLEKQREEEDAAGSAIGSMYDDRRR